jgi:hypothetical protein
MLTLSGKKKESYRANYCGIIDTTDLDATEKAITKSAWLDYLLLLNKQAERSWSLYTFTQIVIVCLGIVIPLIENTNLNAEIANSKLKVVGICGAIIAILTLLARQMTFDQKWLHYRKNAEVVRNEGDDFLALAGDYATFARHQAAYKTFISNLTKLKREENTKYMDNAERNIQKMISEFSKNDKPS